MSYLLFLVCAAMIFTSGYLIGQGRERLRQNRGRVGMIRFAQKWAQARSTISKN